MRRVTLCTYVFFEHCRRRRDSEIRLVPSGRLFRGKARRAYQQYRSIWRRPVSQRKRRVLFLARVRSRQRERK